MDKSYNYAAIFNVYTTLGYKGAKENDTLAQIVDQMSNHPLYNKTDEFYILEKAVRQNPEIGRCVISGQSWKDRRRYDSGTSACIFTDPSGVHYVSYCGTADGEWLDNAKGMYMKSTPQQERAAAYFDDMAVRYGWTSEDQIIITGHSKGGNKAQYTTLMAEHAALIDSCYSMDGQGFSPEAVQAFREKYGDDQYEAILRKMHSLCGENDYVNPFGITIIPEENRMYIETPVGPYDLIGFHEVKQYFLEDAESGTYAGEINPLTGRGDVSRLAEDLSCNIMMFPPEERAAIAMTIMQFMEAGEGRTDGLDGTSLTEEEINTFLQKDVGKIMGILCSSEAGKRLLVQLESDIMKKVSENPGTVIGVMVIASFLLPKIAEMSLFILAGCTILIAAGVEFKDIVNLFFEVSSRLDDLIHGRGLNADYGTFKIEFTTVDAASEAMNDYENDLRYIAEEVRRIKDKVDFGLLTKFALSIQLAGCARNIEARAESLGSMGGRLAEGRFRYSENERKVIERYGK